MHKTLFQKDYRGFRVMLLLDIVGRAKDRFIWRCERTEGDWVLCTGGRAKSEGEALQAADEALSSRPEAEPVGEHTLLQIWQSLYEF